MTTAASITTVGIDTGILAFSPIERWQAIRQLGADVAGERVFVFLCIIALIVLTFLLIIVSYRRRQRDRTIESQSFNVHADRLGLSRRERDILLKIANKAKLSQKEAIFTIPDIFNRQAARLTNEALISQGAKAGRCLDRELTFLREKLGFEQRFSESAGSPVTPSKPSSRQIQTGNKLRIVHHEHEPTDIEATVIKNDDIELALSLTASLEACPGELCRIHYNFGASVWEFDASVVSCHGGILVLTHSYDVRFVNRRRFLRVPVKKQALIASFPFARILATDVDSRGAEEDSPSTWGPPDFIPAAVTELAGPGLRVEAPLEVQVGERVVVILKMSEESDANANDAQARSRQNVVQPRIVEDIGHVRHVRPTVDGYSIAVELTGLSDSNVSELIRETNSASIAADSGTNNLTIEAAEQIAV